MKRTNGAPPDPEPEPSSSSVLVTLNERQTVIKVSDGDNWSFDVRIRDRYVRYSSIPEPGRGAGIWRTGGDGGRERVSPLSLTQIEVGSGRGIALLMLHAVTDVKYRFEGSIDHIADQIHRIGKQLGCGAERRRVFWMVHDIADYARRRVERRAII